MEAIEPPSAAAEQRSAPRASAQERRPEDRLVTTVHSLTLPEGALDYTATTGTVVLREEPEGEEYGRAAAYAEMFSVSYVAQGVAAERPVVFAFNGGPGASTVWLHLGLFGPRRVDTADAGSPVAPPYRLLATHETLLRHADRAMVDR